MSERTGILKFINMINAGVLTSVAGCDRVIQEAQDEKNSLEMRRNKVISMQNVSTQLITEYQQEVEEVNNAIVAITTLIDSMPEGDQKQKKNAERYRLLSVQLNLMVDHGGSEVININRQIELDRIDALVVLIDSSIAVVEARKVELQNAA